jgi:hypothetical protein
MKNTKHTDQMLTSPDAVTAIVTLKVTFNPVEANHPEEWDWNALVDGKAETGLPLP